MVRVSPPTMSAASGELSELMFARRDFVRFQNGARTLRGFVSLPEGPVTRLPGTRFMGFTRDDLPARLMAFQFSDDDAMLLEWTDNALHFWRQSALVMAGVSAYSIATGYSEAALQSLQSLQSADRIYLVDGLHAPKTLSRFAIDTWTIADTTFKGGPFAPRNLDATKEISVSALTGVVTLTATSPVFGAHHVGTLFQLYEIDTSATPYWTADIDARIGDRAYYDNRVYDIVAFDGLSGKTGAVAPVVSGTVVATDNHIVWAYVVAGNPGADTRWAAQSLLKLGDRRWLPAPANVTVEVVGFTPATVDGTKRTTGVNPPVHQEGSWLSEPGGPVWRVLHDGNGIVRITAVANATHATATVQKRLPDGLMDKPTYRWAEAAWSSLRGYPVALGGFGQRHIYGGSVTEPRTIWTSVIGGTIDMTTGPNDDDGFSYILTNLPNKMGKIRTIVPSNTLVWSMWNTDECGSWLKSDDTLG